MLEDALLVDARGNPIRQHHKVYSNLWDEIQAWSSKVYMPYDVTPIGREIRPRSTMHSVRIGRIVMTRFAYGIPVHIKDWDCDAGNAVILTTIRGNARHWVDLNKAEDTKVGETFVVDCSRTDYWVDFDPNHLQLNLTIPHELLRTTCLQWYGVAPDDALWKHKCRIGGRDSSWLSLLEYVVRSVAEAPDQVASGRIGAHMEQAICVRVLSEWAASAGLDLTDPHRLSTPRFVRDAEAYMTSHVADVPTMAEVASSVGVSVRALSGAFREARGTTPSAFMKELRLQGIHRELLAAGPHDTVSSIAYAWGYVNLGIFAQNYRKRFGELPSKTLRRLKSRS